MRSTDATDGSSSEDVLSVTLSGMHVDTTRDVEKGFLHKLEQMWGLAPAYVGRIRDCLAVPQA